MSYAYKNKYKKWNNENYFVRTVGETWVTPILYFYYFFILFHLFASISLEKSLYDALKIHIITFTLLCLPAALF